MLTGFVAILDFLLGGALLFFGRRLFWLVIGAAGFLVGVHLAGDLLSGQAQWVQVLAALAAGGIGALLAIFLQRAALALAGMVAGAALGLHLAQLWGWPEEALWAVLLGGAVGLIAALLLTDWAIIVLSALVGATAIVAALELGPLLGVATTLMLATIGIAVQSKQLRDRRSA